MINEFIVYHHTPTSIAKITMIAQNNGRYKSISTLAPKFGDQFTVSYDGSNTIQQFDFKLTSDLGDQLAATLYLPKASDPSVAGHSFLHFSDVEWNFATPFTDICQLKIKFLIDRADQNTQK